MYQRKFVNRLTIGVLGSVTALAIGACAGSYDGRTRGDTSNAAVESVVAAGRAAAPPQVLQSAIAPAVAEFGAANPLASAGPPAANEEIWVIATPAETDAAADSNEDAEPGSGAMLASFLPDDTLPGDRSIEIPLPLKHTDVRAEIVGYVSTVDVTQQFENPFDTKIEAVYVFPLPEKAAVNEFVMTIGERRIRGILREREEAEAIYAEARAQGYQASLLTQHRPNIFEQKVANIEPGHRIDVNIRYFHTLAYRDGWYSFVFPTVVGPRFNPPGSTDPVMALPRMPAPT